MRVYVFKAAETYGLTLEPDGANLPMDGRWARQAETILVHGEAPFGIDATQAIADIESKGYHLASTDEMLRRSLQY